MTPEQKIDFMILSLQTAKEELEYARKYKELYEKDKKDSILHTWKAKTYTMRNPNGTLIKENLKTVGRMGYLVAKSIKLSRYCDDVT